MIEIRCQNCARPLTLDRDAMARAVAEAQARNEEHYAFTCTQCGHAIQAEVSSLRQNLPDDYPLPEVKVSPPPQVKAAKADQPPSTNIAFVPQWDPAKKRDDTKFLFRLGIAGVTTLWVITLAWLALTDIQDATSTPLPQGVDLAVVLAPVLAAAAGVERFLETIFGIIEHQWRTLVAYLGHGLRWLHSAETEVQEARKWLAEVSDEANKILAQMPTTIEEFEAIVPDTIDQGKTVEEWRATALTYAQKQMDFANDLMGIAEKRLTKAERELAAVVNSSAYKRAKGASCIILGLWLGLVVATIGQMQMFAMLGVDIVPAKVDVLVTGLVIGSGSYPVHSLVGLLQQLKDTLEGTESFLKDKGAQARKLLSQ